MDFHSLPRRQLQTLCKQYKIPANTTNVAMATALDNLLNKGNGLDGEVSGLSVLDLLTPSKSTAESISLDKTGFSGRLTRSQRKKQIEDMRKFEILEPAEEMIEPPVGLPDKNKPPISAARMSMVAVSADHVVAEGAVPTESNNQKPPVSTGKRIRRKVIIDNSDGEESTISQQESYGSKVVHRARSIGRAQCEGLIEEAKTLREEVFGNVSEQSSEVGKNETAQDAVVSSLEFVGKIDVEGKRLHVQMSSLSLESENGRVINVEAVLPKSDECYSTAQELNVDGVESYLLKAARGDTPKEGIGNREAPGAIGGMEDISNSGTDPTNTDPTKGAIEAGCPIVNETEAVVEVESVLGFHDGSLKSVELKEPVGAGPDDNTMVLDFTSHRQKNQEVGDDVPEEQSDGNYSDTETQNESSDCLQVTDETEKDGEESDLSKAACEDAFKDIGNETKGVSSDVESVLKEPEDVDSIGLEEIRCSLATMDQVNQQAGDDVVVEENDGNSSDLGNASSVFLEVTEETEKFQDGAESDLSKAACEDDILKGVDSDVESVLNEPQGVESIGPDEISSHGQEVGGVLRVEEIDGNSSDTTAVESSSLLDLDDEHGTTPRVLCDYKTEKHKETVVNDHAAVDVEQLSSAMADVKLNEYGQMQEEGEQDACGKDSSLGKKIQKKQKKVGHGKENPLFGLPSMSLRKLAKLHKELHEKKKKKSARNDAVTPLSPNTRKNNCAH